MVSRLCLLGLVTLVATSRWAAAQQPVQVEQPSPLHLLSPANQPRPIEDATPIAEEVAVPPPSSGANVYGGKLLGISGVQSLTVQTASQHAVEGQVSMPKDISRALRSQTPSIRYSSDYSVDRNTGAFLVSGEFCHQPTYFEESQLERFGRSRGVFQPAVSAAHFGLNLAALPYMIVVEPPRSCRHYRYPYETGRAAPHFFQCYPVRPLAGVAEAAVIIGMIALIP